MEEKANEREDVTAAGDQIQHNGNGSLGSTSLEVVTTVLAETLAEVVVRSAAASLSAQREGKVTPRAAAVVIEATDTEDSDERPTGREEERAGGGGSKAGVPGLAAWLGSSPQVPAGRAAVRVAATGAREHLEVATGRLAPLIRQYQALTF